jgi:phosphoglycolate phosphatase
MLLLFDFDGVIADSFDTLLNVCVLAQRALGKGRTPTAEDFKTIDNLTFADLGRQIGVPDEDAPDYQRKVLELQQVDWDMRSFVGIAEVMTRLAEAHAVAVVTNSHGERVMNALRQFGLGDVVKQVAGGDTGQTKVERIQQLCNTWGFPLQETAMIGDTVGDIRAGKQAGVKTVAVGWGYQSRERLLLESPDHFVGRPDDFVSVFSQ